MRLLTALRLLSLSLMVDDHFIWFVILFWARSNGVFVPCLLLSAGTWSLSVSFSRQRNFPSSERFWFQRCLIDTLNLIYVYVRACRPTFLRIIKNKSVEEFQPWPYVATMMNCMLWVFYGLPVVHKDSLLVTTINGVGMGFEAIYISIFLIYCGGTKNIRVYIYIIDPLDFDDIDRMFKKKLCVFVYVCRGRLGCTLWLRLLPLQGLFWLPFSLFKMPLPNRPSLVSSAISSTLLCMGLLHLSS